MNLRIHVATMPDALRVSEAIEFKDHLHLNWWPHVPAVDEQSIDLAATRKYGGRLTTDAFDEAGCGFRGKNGREGPRCGKRYDDHRCDTILLVELRRDVTQAEFDAFCHRAARWCEIHGVDGFQPTDGKFRVLQGVEPA